MLKPVFIRLALGTLLLVGGTVGCDSLPPTSQVLPETKTPAASPASGSSNTSSFSSLEQSVHEQVNQYRASKNLPPLRLEPKITEQSRIHSEAMASGKVPFSHQGFEQRVEAIGKTLSYRSAAENVAYNLGYSDPGKQAVEGWIESDGHRKNMEGEFDFTGIGITKNAKGEYYLTQIFIRRR